MLLRTLLTLGLLVGLLADPSFAQNKRGGGSGGTAISVEEEDGAPAVSGVATLKFPNGTVTDNGGNSVSVLTGGAPTDATYITKTANGTLSAETALGGLSTGCVGVTTTSGNLAGRTITGTANEITVTNGNCSGNPTISLPSALDLGGKTVEIPNSNTLPATCNVGEMYMDTDATSGQRFYLCQSANTWVLQGGGGSGASTSNHYLTTQDDTADIPNSVNLGALSTGIFKYDVTLGVATPSTATPGTDYAVPFGSNSWADGAKQTFNPNGTNAGVNVGGHTADPSAPSNGDTYYNSGTDKFRCYEAAAWKDCDTTGGGGMTVGGAIGSSLHNGILYSDNSGNLQELDCANGEVATQVAGAWSCGTVDAASRALDNLASVAINAALIPASAAGLDFGSATKPWKDFYLAGSSGTPGTNNFKITGASTSATRTITLPDATGTAAVYTGTPANNDCPKFAVAGGITTLVTSGAACGGSGTNNIVMTLGTGSGTSNSGFTWADATTYNFGVAEILSASASNEAAVCVPVPVTSTLVKVYYHIRTSGTLQSNDGANTLKIRNQTSATDTTGVSLTFTSATITGNETPSLAFTAGDCVSGKIVTASPATDPTNMKMHATLLFTVP